MAAGKGRKSSDGGERGELLRGLPPFVPPEPRILILGSMPSVASLDAGFYYAHPRNRFFKIIAMLSGMSTETIPERKAALASLHAALFDAIGQCRRQGSLDSAITDEVPNDIPGFLAGHPTIKVVVTNGGLSRKLVSRQALPDSARLFCLPSTSPANAAWSLERLFALYKEAFDAASCLAPQDP
jgi:TDG/mug DNA glycosylase family protein